MVLQVGGCSGRDVDKLQLYGERLGGCCLPGWRDWDGGPIFALKNCLAHLEVRVQSDLTTASGQDAHHILGCQIVAAYVRSSHWDGKIFCPKHCARPYLSFFGSQTFGFVVPTWP